MKTCAHFRLHLSTLPPSQPNNDQLNLTLSGFGLPDAAFASALASTLQQLLSAPAGQLVSQLAGVAPVRLELRVCCAASRAWG